MRVLVKRCVLPRLGLVLGLAASLALAGCSNKKGPAPTATIKGKVVYHGKPVTGYTLYLDNGHTQIPFELDNNGNFGGESNDTGTMTVYFTPKPPVVDFTKMKDASKAKDSLPQVPKAAPTYPDPSKIRQYTTPKSPEKCEIKKGENDLTIDLK